MLPERLGGWGEAAGPLWGVAGVRGAGPGLLPRPLAPARPRDRSEELRFVRQRRGRAPGEGAGSAGLCCKNSEISLGG